VIQLLRTLLLAVLAAAASACQSLPAATGYPAPGRLQRIVDSGELRVGVSADLPPLNMKNEQQEIVGFEIDLVTALAAAMDLEVRFVEKPFPDLLATLEDGQVDLVISGLTMTPERNTRVAFAGPYFISGTSIVTKAKELANARDITQLDDPERTYVALAGSTSERFVSELLPQAKLVSTQDYETGIQMVIDGDADALVADFLRCTFATWHHPEAGLTVMRPPFTIEPLGIALPPDAPLLLNLVSNYLNTLEDTGLLGQFKAKWLADGSWMSEYR
jgi:polar amino acid transport system substrate-binding protein